MNAMELVPLPALRSAYNSLTRSEKQLAAYISENTQDFLQGSLPELARETGKSEVTWQRFSKKLGFNGVRELKLALASVTSNNEAEGIYGDIHIGDETKTVAAKLFKNISDGLMDTLSLLDFGEIERAADALEVAARVAVYGFGNSYTVCHDIETRFLRFGIPVQAYADSHLQATSAALLTPHDVAIAISHSGNTKDLLDSVAIAKSRGATVIAITSHAGSALAKGADIVLHGMGREVRYRSEAVASRLVHMAIADVLYTVLAMRHPENYLENIKRMREEIAKKKI